MGQETEEVEDEISLVAGKPSRRDDQDSGFVEPVLVLYDGKCYRTYYFKYIYIYYHATPIDSYLKYP
jgi:hypothetical protein